MIFREHLNPCSYLNKTLGSTLTSAPPRVEQSSERSRGFSFPCRKASKLVNLSPLLSRSLETRARILSPGVGVTTVVALSGRINLHNNSDLRVWRRNFKWPYMSDRFPKDSPLNLCLIKDKWDIHYIRWTLFIIQFINQYIIKLIAHYINLKGTIVYKI